MRFRLFALALVAASASAQTAPDVVGTWEMEVAVDVPVEDDLVFARLTITDDIIRSLSVFVDPDDGETSVRRTRGRYTVSDGQLVMRENNGVTVLAVERIGDRLIVRDLETGVGLRLVPAPAGRSLDAALVGTWTGMNDGEPLSYHFRADGTGTVTLGDDTGDTDWEVAGPYLLLGDLAAPYAVNSADGRARLAVDVDGVAVVLRRAAD